MTILYYDKNDGSGWAPEYLHRFREAISKTIDDKILLIPKDIDVIFDASAEQLIALRDYINSALKEKENK
jgi:hypothetical protein